MVTPIGIGDWMGVHALLNAEPAAPVSVPVPIGSDPPVFRSSVTTIDPLWFLAAAVLLYLLFRKG